MMMTLAICVLNHASAYCLDSECKEARRSVLDFLVEFSEGLEGREGRGMVGWGDPNGDTY